MAHFTPKYHSESRDQDRIGEHRFVLFAAIEVPENTENTENAAKEQVVEKDVDTEAIGNKKAEQLARVREAEKHDRASDETKQGEIAHKIEALPTLQVLEAISQIEKMYRGFAERMNRNADPIDMTIADPVLEPVCRAWNQTRLGPERRAIEDALNAALRRATADTPNVEFHASGVGGSLGIAGSGGSAVPSSEQANDRPSPAPIASPGQRLMSYLSYLRSLFGRASMERIGTPAIDRFNRESTLATASVSPGTTWSEPRNGRPQPDSLVPGAYNLEIRLRTPLSEQQIDHFEEMIFKAAGGQHGGQGIGPANDCVRIYSLTPVQITVALQTASRWEQAQTAGNRANDEFRGVPLQDRSAVLNSYRLLQTDAQRTFFRLAMRAPLEMQVPLARVLTRLTPRMTQELSDGGPLHEPDITNFQKQVRSMSPAEKEMLRQLPIGDRANLLYFPDERGR